MRCLGYLFIDDSQYGINIVDGLIDIVLEAS
jgi:hypothetical protein